MRYQDSNGREIIELVDATDLKKYHLVDLGGGLYIRQDNVDLPEPNQKLSDWLRAYADYIDMSPHELYKSFRDDLGNTFLNSLIKE